MVPARAGLLAASPVRPLPGVAGRVGRVEAGEQALDLGNGQRDHPGIGERRLAGPGAFWDLQTSAGPLHGDGRAKAQQQPTQADKPLLAWVYEHFKDRPHDFEQFAADLWRMTEPKATRSM